MSNNVLLCRSAKAILFLLDAMNNDEMDCREALIGGYKNEEVWCIGTQEDIEGDVYKATGTCAIEYDVLTDQHYHLLPACLWVTREDNAARIVWVHSLYRRSTIGTQLVCARKPKCAMNVETEAGLNFWDKLGYRWDDVVTNALYYDRANAVL